MNRDSATSYDYQEESFLRRYRYQHLATKSKVPMSIRNYDRHGMGNLMHEPVKPLDRFKIPPFVLYALVFGIFGYFVVRTGSDKGLNIEQLRRENMLKAMRKNREKVLYDTEKEVTPAEQLQMKTLQYKEVKQQQRREKDTLSDLKRNLLRPEGSKASGSISDRTIDIQKLQQQ